MAAAQLSSRGCLGRRGGLGLAAGLHAGERVSSGDANLVSTGDLSLAPWSRPLVSLAPRAGHPGAEQLKPWALSIVAVGPRELLSRSQAGKHRCEGGLG